ncbi:MAG TPA: type II toxin-antitoxin system VapC family toxin [Thermoanaerobaculia bacterium]
MILLDTHVVFWLSTKPDRLSRKAASAIRRALAGSGIAIASITLWELAHQIARGRIRVQGTTEAFIEELVEQTGVVVREITPEIAALAVHFPESFPGDPADRLIAATARAVGMPLVTADDRLLESALVETIW